MHRTTDDLKTIKGIAETRETWLHEIGVHTIEDLASSRAVTIQEKLHTAGHTAPLTVIEDWIAKAKTYMESVAAQAVVKTGSSARIEKSDSSPTEWETFAEFFVDYQHRPTDNGSWEQRTKVHRMRNGGKDKFWEGLAGESVGRWMLEQLGEVEPLPLTKKTRPSPPSNHPAPPKSPPQITLSIQGVELSQQTSDTKVPLHETGRTFSRPVNSETPFDLLTIVKLKGDVNASNGGTPHIAIQAYTTNKSTGETILLGESEPQPLLPGQTQQRIKLSEIRLTQGIYRLQLMLRSVELPGVLGFLEVPFLWVT